MQFVFRGSFVVNIAFALTEPQRYSKFALGWSPHATSANEFAHFNVVCCRHNKVFKFTTSTLLLAQAKARFLKVNKIDGPVARVWGTSAKPKGNTAEIRKSELRMLIESNAIV